VVTKLALQNAKNKSYRVLVSAIISMAAVVLPLCDSLLAANYPLNIFNIEGTGNDNRIRFAYPGIEYRVRIGAEGGTYPFSWQLQQAPPGMSIEAATGRITWVPPAAYDTAHTVTVSVRDKEGNVSSKSYSILITTSTDRFLFIDAAATGTKTGSIAQPFASLSEIWDSDHGGKIIYFRSGTYTIPHKNNIIRHASKTNIFSTNPKSYLGYPGETVIIDEECDPSIPDGGDGAGNYPGYLLNLFGGVHGVYFENLIFDNIYYYGLSSYGSNYLTVLNCRFRNAYTSDLSENQSYINYMVGSSSGHFIADNTFGGEESSISGGSNFAAILTYTFYNGVIEDNIITGLPNSGIFLKSGIACVFVRHNRLFSVHGSAINLYAGDRGANGVEACFNLMKDCPAPIYLLNDVGNNINQYIYRNTVVNTTADGPIIRGISSGYFSNVIFSNNVFHNVLADVGTIGTNSFSRHRCLFSYISVDEYNSVTFYDNLEGDNLVDSNGHLLNAADIGKYGWQTGTEEYTSESMPPASPGNLIVK